FFILTLVVGGLADVRGAEGGARVKSFDELVASVSQPPAPEKISPEEEARLAYCVSEDAIKTRKAEVWEKASRLRPGDSPNGKQSLRVDLARLERNPKDAMAWKNVVLVAPYAGKSAHFTKIMLAYTYGKYHATLSPDVLAALRQQAADYGEFLGNGTENHIGMQRISGGIFGAAFPDLQTSYKISGEKLELLTEEWVPRYAQAVYAASMKEYLSMIYLGVHNEIWLTAREYGPTDRTRRIGQAMLDWIWTDLAVNTHLGQTAPPTTRAKLMLNRNPPMNFPSSHAQWLAWLYWGDLRSHQGHEPLAPAAAALTANMNSKEMLEDNDGFQTAIVPSISPMKPNEIVRNLGAKKVRLPYMLLQSRAHGAFVPAVAANPFLKIKVNDEAEITRNHLRSVYVARDYSLGLGYFRNDEIGGNEQYMHVLPTAITYRSSDLLNSIYVSHPYWYAGMPHGNEGESNKVFGLDCWLGKSPFEQSLHWENTAMYLYNIPKTDPSVAAAEPKDAAKWTDSRLENPLRKVCVYVPASIDEIRQTSWGWLLREGDVYVAIRPLNATKANWETCTNEVQKGYKRLVLDGSLFGIIIEMGDAAEYGSAEEFIAKISETTVDTSRLTASKRIDYVSTRGIPFSLEFNESSWFPKASVKGVGLDFEQWPICESPYVNCRNGVLDVNDGKSGFTVSWQNDTPVYSHYSLSTGSTPRPK
ncbi:MAG: hypothetical protein KJT03_09150, partial [Verrucomicrobiae bacterium]|nr:hypothetical protein [Verrucomicrobiae bacterium]